MSQMPSWAGHCLIRRSAKSNSHSDSDAESVMHGRILMYEKLPCAIDSVSLFAQESAASSSDVDELIPFTQIRLHDVEVVIV